MRTQIDDLSNYFLEGIKLKYHLIILPVCVFMFSIKPTRMISYHASDHEVLQGLKLS